MNENTFLDKLVEVEKELKLNFDGKTFLQMNLWKKDVANIPKEAETTAKKVIVYQDLATGERTFSVPKNIQLLISKKSKSANAYVFDAKYIDQIKCVALCEYKIDINPIEEGDKRDWKLNRVFFVDSKKDIYTRSGYSYTSSKSYYSKCLYYGVQEIIKNPCIYGKTYEKVLCEAFKPIFPVALFGGNKYHSISNEYILIDFLRYNEPIKRNTKSQNQIDEYLKLPLPELDKNDFDFDHENSKWIYNTAQLNFTVIIDKVKDGLACLRFVYVDAYSKSAIECSRLYVSKTKSLFCRKNSFGEYIVITGKLNKDNFKANNVIIHGENTLKDTKLEYYEEIFDEADKDKLSGLIWCFLYQDLSEKFYKAGLSKIIYSYLDEIFENKFSKYLSDCFGFVDFSATSPAKMLGINKHQLKRLSDYLNSNKDSYNKIIDKIKTALNTNNISSYTNDIFDQIFDTFCEYADKFGFYHYRTTISNCFAEIMEIYSLKTALKCLPNFLKLANQTITVEKSYITGLTVQTKEYAEVLYFDYIHMVKLLNASKTLKPYFDSIDDVVNMHDGLVAIFNAKENEIKKDAFDKRKKVWEKFEYNDPSESLCVISPNGPEDLANEGITLHHCVKSYIDRVTDGITNIVFIRKKDDIETPFFTVEISNIGSIEQVHGFGNRNACTEPGLEKFINRWCKQCKLNQTNFNKVR